MIADLLLTDEAGDPVAVVEIKRGPSESAERQVLKIRDVAGARFAVLFTPPEVAVWDAPSEPPERTPGDALLSPLRAEAGVPDGVLPDLALVMFVELYFEDLAAGRARPPAGPAGEALAAAACGGRVEREVRVFGHARAAA